MASSIKSIKSNNIVNLDGRRVCYPIVILSVWIFSCSQDEVELLSAEDR